MIEINEFKLPILPTEARSFIQNQTDSFGVFFDVDRMNEYRGLLSIENRHLRRELKKMSHNPSLDVKDKGSIIEALVKMGVNRAEFNGSSYNADTRKKILNNPKYSEDVVHFVKLTDK